MTSGSNSGIFNRKKSEKKEIDFISLEPDVSYGWHHTHLLQLSDTVNVGNIICVKVGELTIQIRVRFLFVQITGKHHCLTYKKPLSLKIPDIEAVFGWPPSDPTKNRFNFSQFGHLDL